MKTNTYLKFVLLFIFFGLFVFTGKVQAACTCETTELCNTACTFNKFPAAAITTYSSPTKCNVIADIFNATPTAANKKNWCLRPNRTKGDANGDSKVNFLDYFYFVSKTAGAKIPPGINLDFDGNGAINDDDKKILIKSLLLIK